MMICDQWRTETRRYMSLCSFFSSFRSVTMIQSRAARIVIESVDEESRIVIVLSIACKTTFHAPNVQCSLYFVFASLSFLHKSQSQSITAAVL
jgi:hypothetical protein